MEHALSALRAHDATHTSESQDSSVEESSTGVVVSSDAPARTIKCDRMGVCDGSPVAYIDCKGYAYCTPCGVSRQYGTSCRKLERGEQIRYGR